MEFKNMNKTNKNEKSIKMYKTFTNIKMKTI